MHDVTPFGIAAKYVGDDFAEGAGEDAFVYVFDGVVYILFGGAYAAQIVTLVAHYGNCC